VRKGCCQFARSLGCFSALFFDAPENVCYTLCTSPELVCLLFWWKLEGTSAYHIHKGQGTFKGGGGGHYLSSGFVCVFVENFL
jgi:hypothetical protein